MQTIFDLTKFDSKIKNKKDSFSENLNLRSFFLLLKLSNKFYSDNSERILFDRELEKLINAGLKNLEISWSNNNNWFDFVSKIRDAYPKINLGSASIINEQSIEDSLKIGLEFSMDGSTENIENWPSTSSNLWL